MQSFTAKDTKEAKGIHSLTTKDDKKDNSLTTKDTKGTKDQIINLQDRPTLPKN
jgi:hypothetical protein